MTHNIYFLSSNISLSCLFSFNDQEIVALAGAHALGRCHTDRSGFDGPWTFSPTTFTNAFYSLLMDEKSVSASIEYILSDWSCLDGFGVSGMDPSSCRIRRLARS